jgi:hypothetical protein
VRWKEGEYWLRDAVKYVKFPPDRRKVQQELYEHMISRNLDFLAKGASEEEADKLVCQAMGDPEEVGKALAEVHKPFWGYFLRVLRIVTVIVLLFLAVHVLRTRDSYTGSLYHRYTAVRSSFEAHMDRWIGQSSAEKCGDYRFRLRRAGVASSGEGDLYIPEGDYLVLELRASTRDPGLGTPRLEQRKLTVEDNLGNRYETFVLVTMDWILFSDLLIEARDFDPAAEWAVLSYDSGEQSFRLPVKLEVGK